MAGQHSTGERTRLAEPRRLQDHFRQSAWLNPEPGRFWYGNTIEYVASVFDMYPLTLAGLGEAMGQLIKGRRV